MATSSRLRHIAGQLPGQTRRVVDRSRQLGKTVRAISRTLARRTVAWAPRPRAEAIGWWLGVPIAELNCPPSARENGVQ
ncbi:MAG TPA: hypothetical protein VFR23_02090 [Jiangellaceae bacterium]|nr:hypothetical protein [Jiangellaceae bacterium]